MKKYGFKSGCKGLMVVAVLGLALPSAARADHILDVDTAEAGGQVTLAGSTPVGGGDVLFTGQSLSSWTVDGRALIFGGDISLKAVNIKLCKQGTNNQLEWLNAGFTTKGATTATPLLSQSFSITSTPVVACANGGGSSVDCTSSAARTKTTTTTTTNTQYKLGLTFSSALNSSQCSSAGQEDHTYTRNYTIDKVVATTVTVLTQTGNPPSGTGTTTNTTTTVTTPGFKTGTYMVWNPANTVPEPGTVLLMLSGLMGVAWLTRRRTRASA